MADASLTETDAVIRLLVERAESDPNARALKNYQRGYRDFREGKQRPNGVTLKTTKYKRISE